MEGKLGKYLRVNRREEGKWEDLERDGWKKLKRSTGDEGSNMVTKGSGQRRMDCFLQKFCMHFSFHLCVSYMPLILSS